MPSEAHQRRTVGTKIVTSAASKARLDLSSPQHVTLSCCQVTHLCHQAHGLKHPAELYHSTPENIPQMWFSNKHPHSKPCHVCCAMPCCCCCKCCCHKYPPPPLTTAANVPKALLHQHYHSADSASKYYVALVLHHCHWRKAACAFDPLLPFAQHAALQQRVVGCIEAAQDIMAGHYPHNIAAGLHHWQQIHLQSTKGSRPCQC